MARVAKKASVEAGPVVGLWELPEGWRWERLQDVAEINPKTELGAAGDEPVTFLGMAAVSEESGRVDVSVVRPASHVAKGFTRFRTGDVLFAKITPCMENGKMAVVPEMASPVGAGSTEFHVIRSSALHPRYLFHYLVQSDIRQDARRNMSGSAGQMRVPTDYLRLLPVPVPPKAVQDVIVARIDELFGEIDDGERCLSAARRGSKGYRDALLREAFSGRLTEHWRARNASVLSGADLRDQLLIDRTNTRRGRKGSRAVATPLELGVRSLPASWAVASIEELCDPDRLIAYGVLQPGPNMPDGLKLVRVGDINGGLINQAEMKRIAPEVAASYSRTTLRGGEVLLTVVGSIGRTAVVPAGLAGANVARAVAVLPVRSVEPEWVEFYLRYEPNRRALEGASHEVARKTLNLEDVRRFSVAIPPAAERAEILALVESRLEDLREAASPLERASSLARQQRQSILAAAFRGDLVA